MACPICGARCKCKNRGPGGLCCGCHKHKAQRGFRRERLNEWRSDHKLEPITDRQWSKQYAKDERVDDRPLLQQLLTDLRQSLDKDKDQTDDTRSDR